MQNLNGSKGKRDEELMKSYESYREKIERQHNKALVEVMKDLYIKNDLGPSVSAKQLGMPRKAFVYFIKIYDLKKFKSSEYYS